MPDWARLGADWPNRDMSRFVDAAGITWHVQTGGEGPPLLLIHGTAASTHSWRDLLPRLTPHFSVIAPDLPGHGFSGTRRQGRLGLSAMALMVSDLVATLGHAPVLAAGHSAGAAILARMALDGHLPKETRRLVAFNGALLPFDGMAGRLFPSMAKALFVNPLTPRLFAWGADKRQVARLIRDTGSEIDARGIELYARLFKERIHVGGALSMMANWDLAALEADLPRLELPLTLAVGTRDRAVRPADARRVADMVPHATIERMTGLGHLAHEEDPDGAAALLRAAHAAETAAPDATG